MPGGIRSNVDSVEWPPISTGNAAVLAALIRQLDDTQWLPAEEIARRQRAQVVRLATHCAEYSRQFRARLVAAKLKPDDLGEPGGLADLPLLSRRDLQLSSLQLYCAQLPSDHLPQGETRTSGSTGEPVVVRRTNVTQFFWLAMVMRDHLWHRRDLGRRLAAVRAKVGEVARAHDWGPPASLLYRTGPSLSIGSTTGLEKMLELLAGFQPDSLLIYPNLLDGLLRFCRERGRTPPAIRHVRTTGETLSPDLREDASAQFKAKVEDCYSSEELGYIALECPDSGLYHAMAESLIVEVLDDSGRPCREGEIGRIVATDLHNFATPLVRYDIGDYAEVAGPCPCGRGLPTLRRILGRERNLMLMPDGTRQWPRTGYRNFRDIAPIRQFQFAQLDRQTVEVRLVADGTLSLAQEHALRAHIHQAIGHPFALRFAYFADRIPPGTNGKFEDFLCLATMEAK
jgi:phenylacetate-CoA ligase